MKSLRYPKKRTPNIERILLIKNNQLKCYQLSYSDFPSFLYISVIYIVPNYVKPKDNNLPIDEPKIATIKQAFLNNSFRNYIIISYNFKFFLYIFCYSINFGIPVDNTDSY